MNCVVWCDVASMDDANGGEGLAHLGGRQQGVLFRKGFLGYTPDRYTP
jgi:hypothetical protein